MSRLRKLFLMDEHTCPWWFVHSFDNPLRRLAQDPHAILAGLVGEGQTVVDVGCGAGYFTLPLAEMVGVEGRVLAMDLQQEMLDMARRRAKRRGVNDNIEFRRCDPNRLGLREAVDFALAFWMVHEVSDPRALLLEIKAHLKPEGALLVVEPKVHVTPSCFEATASLARAIGFRVAPGPKVFFSRAILCSTSASSPGREG